MSKRRSHKPSPQPSTQAPHAAITQEQLAEAISLGIEKAETRRKAAEKKEKESAREQWRGQLKRPKNYDSLKGWKAACIDFHSAWVMICMSFRRREVKEGPLVLHNFIAVLLSQIFVFIRICSLVGAILYAVFRPVVLLLSKELSLKLVGSIIGGIVYGVLLLFFSAIFKFIAEEIVEIDDTAFLISLTSLLFALASIIISIVI